MQSSQSHYVFQLSNLVTWMGGEGWTQQVVKVQCSPVTLKEVGDKIMQNVKQHNVQYTC